MVNMSEWVGEYWGAWLRDGEYWGSWFGDERDDKVGKGRVQ